LLFHTDVYAIADRFQVDALKALAEDKFKICAQKSWNDTEFPDAVQAVYSVAPPGSNGDSFRSIASSFTAQHAYQLFAKNNDLSSMLEGQAELGRDLAKALSYMARDDAQALQCNKPSCGMVSRVQLEGSAPNLLNIRRCPVCGKAGTRLVRH
jgi:hypothetical protein